MDFNKIFQSKTFKTGIFILVGLLVFLFIFKLGLVVGFKKANFSYKWGENYHRNFAGPRQGFFRGFSDREFIDAHGVFGQIIKIDDSDLIIKGRDEIEKIVLVNEKTLIKSFRETIKLTDLKIDDYVVIIGEPNESGQIEAKFIRLVPPNRPPVSFNFSPSQKRCR